MNEEHSKGRPQNVGISNRRDQKKRDIQIPKSPQEIAEEKNKVDQSDEDLRKAEHSKVFDPRPLS